MENIMLFSPMPVLQAIQDSFTESILADMHAEDAEIFAESIPARKSGKSRYDKKAMKRKGSAKRFRDRSRKCASEGHMYSVYSHGEKRSRTHSVNIHFTNGCTTQDIYNLTETDVHEYYSVTTWDGYESMEDFFQYMDNIDWDHIPKEVRFFTEANTIDPFGEQWYKPEYFAMNATLRRDGISAEKAKEEYLKFKKRYQIFKKYAKELHTLYEKMCAELRA